MGTGIYAANRSFHLRSFYSFSRAQIQVQVPKTTGGFRQPEPSATTSKFEGQGPPEKSVEAPENSALYVKRNEVGVQLLSRSLHSQIFKNVSFPAPHETFVQIAKDHLGKHNLELTALSTHPDISFTLPPLQGPTIDAHFHSIGTNVAEPYLSLAKDFASHSLPPRPESWVIQSGWTKYWAGEDGVHDAVESPNEEMLVFDVESMPAHHQFAVMACAASRTAWYSWISPWLLEQSTEPRQLIPLGSPTQNRVVVGHNVSYDRARTLEEYSLERTGTRWLDTMALHVAVNGISSHQRPAGSKYTTDVLELIKSLKKQALKTKDEERREDLRRQMQDLEVSLPSPQAITEVWGDPEDDTEGEKRWEDVTSANSLADVARLHCDIKVDISTPNDFMTAAPAEILADVSTYLSYCANNVAVTHKVFRKTLPAFLEKCPSPVSFAGMCSMGNSFLTVDEHWERYLAIAEGKYRELEARVGHALRKLAEDARLLRENDGWKGDVWLEQLDWSPKASRTVINLSPHPSADQEPIRHNLPPREAFKNKHIVPKWLNDFKTLGVRHPHVRNTILPYLLRLQIDSSPVRFHAAHGWHTLKEDVPVDAPYSERVTTRRKHKLLDIFDKVFSITWFNKGRISRQGNQSMRPYVEIVSGIKSNNHLEKTLSKIARRLAKSYQKGLTDTDRALWWPWIKELDWTPTPASGTDVPKKPERPEVPKWYWQLGKSNLPANEQNIDITIRSRIAPILLKLKWKGWPLVFSREHGWTFRVAKDALASGKFTMRQKELSFSSDADEALLDVNEKFAFFELPWHEDDNRARGARTLRMQHSGVGSPLSETFLKFAANGTLSSPDKTATDVLDMNAQCSYWSSARDHIMKQMVVWDDDGRQGLPRDCKWGTIIPQVITMGTVTRRAIEKTWLTASNAKANRIGSELKAMVRAPPGYALVGAEVDSKELWISSCMGDAQFGLHGATAIGWMTLEGAKKAETVLHTKTASILRISRGQAKVFNYSRIYGAGMKDAMLLLLQNNTAMLPERAQKLAERLYASTKGENTHRMDIFGRKFWFGGTESFMFNKLEEIALSDLPRTPALGCGVTYALSKLYLLEKFGSDYLPSRINWVVQSSGVDYLHLLIVAMEHLTRKYDIQARYLISMHDELRYLVKEEDKYRAALALQIANVWTRSLFAYRLGMDDLPQGLAFFSAVDVDKVLRKEVDMTCITPSQPAPIPPGETLDIATVLQKTNSGSLWKDESPMETEPDETPVSDAYVPPDCLVHRAKSAAWLKAQATDLIEEVKFIAQRETGQVYQGGIGTWSFKNSGKKGKKGKKGKADSAGSNPLKRPRGRPR